MSTMAMMMATMARDSSNDEMTTTVFGISDGLSPHPPLLRLHPRRRRTSAGSSTPSIARAGSCLGRPTRRYPRRGGRRIPCPRRSSGSVLVPTLVCALFSLALLLVCDPFLRNPGITTTPLPGGLPAPRMGPQWDPKALIHDVGNPHTMYEGPGVPIGSPSRNG